MPGLPLMPITAPHVAQMIHAEALLHPTVDALAARVGAVRYVESHGLALQGELAALVGAWGHDDALRRRAVLACERAAALMPCRATICQLAPATQQGLADLAQRIATDKAWKTLARRGSIPAVADQGIEELIADLTSGRRRVGEVELETLMETAAAAQLARQAGFDARLVWFLTSADEHAIPSITPNLILGVAPSDTARVVQALHLPSGPLRWAATGVSLGYSAHDIAKFLEHVGKRWGISRGAIRQQLTQVALA